MASLISRPSKTGPVYVQYWQGPKQKRFRASDNFQVAKQKLRDFENAQARGDDSRLPTATPIAEVVTAYVEHLRQATTPKSCQTNIYYLRDLFGPICEALKVTQPEGVGQGEETAAQARLGPEAEGKAVQWNHTDLPPVTPPWFGSPDSFVA